MELLNKNQNNIDWGFLSKNAIELLKKNPHNIVWNALSENPNAMLLLKENQDKINWYNFSKNPNIFTYDYKKMKENIKKSGIAEKLTT